MTDDKDLLISFNITLSSKERIVVEGVDVVAIDADEDYPCNHGVGMVAVILLEDIIEISRSDSKEENQHPECHPTIESAHGVDCSLEKRIIGGSIQRSYLLHSYCLQVFDAGEDVTEAAGERWSEPEIENDDQIGDGLEDVPYSHRFCRHLVKNEWQENESGSHSEESGSIAPKDIFFTNIFYLAVGQCGLILQGSMLKGEDEGDDWSGEECGIEAIEESSATRYNVSAIFDADSALEETFHQVAQCAGDGDDCCKRNPFPGWQVSDEDGEDISGKEGKEEASDESFPRFARADAGEHLMLANERAYAVGAGVVCPDNDEERQENEFTHLPLVMHEDVVHKCKRKSNHYLRN